MANDTANAGTRFEEWAAAMGASVDEVATAWQDLERRGLATESAGQVTISPLAMRRATSDVQRRLCAPWRAIFIPQFQISDRKLRWDVRDR